MIPLALLLVLVATILLWQSGRQRRATGLPTGRVISSDMRGWDEVEKPLYDPVSGLTGKPDYLVEQKNGKVLIPVEVKSGRAPTIPYDSHVFQLAAYCLLVERTHGTRPPYGILRYRDRTFAIDYTATLRQELEKVLDEMRQELRQQDRGQAGHCSHQEPARCARCGYRKYCNERL